MLFCILLLVQARIQKGVLGSCPQDGPQVTLFVHPCIAFLPYFSMSRAQNERKSLSAVKFWLPDVNNQPFSNGFFC